MKNVYEIFEEVSKTNSKNEKMQILRNNATYALKNVLKGTFDPNISFVFDKIPEYKPSDAPPGLGYSSIHQELGRVYLFEQNSPKVSPSLTMKRKEEILIQMLESLEKKEAEVFANMLLKKQKVKGLTYNLVKETFPDLL